MHVRDFSQIIQPDRCSKVSLDEFENSQKTLKALSRGRFERLARSKDWGEKQA